MTAYTYTPYIPYFISIRERVYTLDDNHTVRALPQIYASDKLTEPGHLDADLYGDLPTEIKLRVMDYVVESLWRNRQFEFIHPTICTNRFFLDRYYRIYIHPVSTTKLVQSSRIASIIMTISRIFESICIYYPDVTDSYFALSLDCLGKMGEEEGMLDPWDFSQSDEETGAVSVSVDCHDIAKPNILSLRRRNWNAFRTGGRPCDAIWMDGHFSRSTDMYHASSFQQPVVVLFYTDSMDVGSFEDSPIFSYEELIDSSSWKMFDELLRHCLGSNSAVYYVVTDDAEYTEDDSVYVIGEL